MGLCAEVKKFNAAAHECQLLKLSGESADVRVKTGANVE